MAKQTSIIPFTGKLGDRIGYQRNRRYFLRSMPQTIRQTTATRRAALRFGIASRKAAAIRKAFYPDLDLACDNSHVNRLNKVLIVAGSNHTAIKGFRFNQYTGTDIFFTVAPTLSRNEVLQFPNQRLAQHKGISTIEVKVIAKRIDFTAQQVTGSETIVFMIDPTVRLERTNVAFNVPGEGTLVVTLQVRGINNEEISSNRRYLAADIIAVAPPASQTILTRRSYPAYTTSPAVRALRLACTYTDRHLIRRE